MFCLYMNLYICFVFVFFYNIVLSFHNFVFFLNLFIYVNLYTNVLFIYEFIYLYINDDRSFS